MKKRWLIYILAVFVISVSAMGMAEYMTRKEVPDFEIVSSIKTGADNFQSVSISAVVNVKDYDVEEMLSRIRDYYYGMNGEVDELDISLFDSREDLENDIVAAEASYPLER